MSYITSIRKQLAFQDVRQIYAIKGRLINQSVYEEIKKRKHCKVCGKKRKKSKFLEVHHKVPVSKGGSNDVTNLIGVCHACHIKLHKELDKLYSQSTTTEKEEL